MIQKITSKNTSINIKKLPASTKKINWEIFKDTTVLDFGCGKAGYLLQDYLSNYNIEVIGYDPYHQFPSYNKQALLRNDYSLIICNNVLNVLTDDILPLVRQQIIDKRRECKCDLVIQIYEGNKSGIGKQTGKDQYQRNEITKEYWTNFYDTKEQYFVPMYLYKGLIVSKKGIIL